MNKRIYSDITASIKSLDPTAEVSVVGNDIKKITWFDNNPNNITEEQILAKRTELEAEYDAQDYARKREAEYPSIKDQLDKIYHEGIDKWKEDMIKPVKDKHPKA